MAHANTPFVAILDLHLNDGECTTVARALAERSIPFIVCSGRNANGDLDEIFLKGEWLDKPTPPDKLVAAVVAHVVG